MKLVEVTRPESEDEPLLITMMKVLLAEKKRIARYYRAGSDMKPEWIVGIRRDKETGPPPSNPPQEEPDDWTFLTNRGSNVNYLTFPHKDFDDNFELVPGRSKGTWEFRRVRRQQ